MYQSLVIEYTNPFTVDSIALEYRLRSNPVVERWIERVETAKKTYSIDDPDRFYGFGSIEYQQQQALWHINAVIDTVNQERDIIWRRPQSVYDQDCLNYLHHIFEVYHGLLDQNPDSNPRLRSALSRLNVCVHRCESVARGADPRHVVTWFGLPKDKFLDDNDYEHAVQTWQAGTVFLNYVEVGKTLQDLAEDNDQYISAEAFQPFRHYSADFVVRFFGRTQAQADERYQLMYQYYLRHKDHFGPWQPCYTNAGFALADLVGPLNLDLLSTRQCVKSVEFI